ncbi:MAG: hypothetical protein U5N86_11280 [Planctomycetota bacterium]|nr:hypothetical protein [Planctomycetota bacterium]
MVKRLGPDVPYRAMALGALRNNDTAVDVFFVFRDELCYTKTSVDYLSLPTREVLCPYPQTMPDDPASLIEKGYRELYRLWTRDNVPEGGKMYAGHNRGFYIAKNGTLHPISSPSDPRELPAGVELECVYDFDRFIGIKDGQAHLFDYAEGKYQPAHEMGEMMPGRLGCSTIQSGSLHRGKRQREGYRIIHIADEPTPLFISKDWLHDLRPVGMTTGGSLLVFDETDGHFVLVRDYPK